MKGLGVSPGIGIGKAFIIDKKSMNIEKIHVNDTDMEITRFRDAIEVGKIQLNELYMKTLEEVGEKEAQIFKSHEMMLEDETFASEVEIKIKNEKVNAVYALNETSNTYIKLFENIEDEYLRERAEDIKDVMTRVIKILLGIKTTDYSRIEKNSVIIAKDLTPSDTAQIDKNNVSAMITEMGGKTSHAAIIARLMGIPTVVGLENILNKIQIEKINIVKPICFSALFFDKYSIAVLGLIIYV